MHKLNLSIEKLASNGAGIARHEGKIYFVPWGVPGDKVLVQVEKERKDYNEARLLEIVEKSPDHAEPLCPYFYKCGGCQLQHLTYPAQLKWKREIVRDALKRIARLPENSVAEVLPSPKIWNYRTRIQLHQDRQGKVGFYKPESHEVVEIERCLIADERLNEKIASHAAPAIELRVDDSPGFSQINPEQNQNLIHLVLEYLDVQPEDTVFDVYCGSGNFTFSLASRVRHVWGIEKHESSLEEARQKMTQEGIENISWKQGSAFKVLHDLFKQQVSCDRMVVDPPRRGLDEVLEAVLLFKPMVLVYVSCNPATFARDAACLVKAGYQLTHCQPIDMFPQTAHVEIVSGWGKGD